MVDNKNFSISEFSKTRPVSWSAIGSFEWNPEEWYQKYILGIKEPPSPAMLFGTKVGQELASNPKFMPDVLRYPQFEKELRAEISGINIIGSLDSFDPETKAFYEYKTSSNKNKWTFKSVKEHGQILMYMLMIWINFQIDPSEIKCSLFYIPVLEVNGKMKLSNLPNKPFPVSHTKVEALKFGVYIKKTAAAMEAYVRNHE